MTAPQFQLCSDDFDNFARLARTSDNVLVSPKMDGFRCGATLMGEVRLWSRSGLRFPLGQVFADGLCSFQSALGWGVRGRLFPLDCELTHDHGLEVLREIVQGQQEDRYHELALNIFDICIPDIDLRARTAILAEAFARFDADAGPGSVRLVDHGPLAGPLTEENLDSVRDFTVAMGFEGAVFKVADGPYLPGLSPYWHRRVPFLSVDLPVVRIDRKRHGRGELTAMVCDHCGVEVRVAVGFTHEQRHAFSETPPGVVEVFHRGITRKGSLRSPVFRRPRPDKILHDV